MPANCGFSRNRPAPETPSTGWLAALDITVAARCRTAAPSCVGERTLDDVAHVGRERRRGRHAAKLRLYYVALRRGWASSHRSKVDVHWSEDLVIEWCKILQLPPYQHAYPVRTPHSRCSRCKDRPNNEGGSFQTESTFPGGWKVRCSNCGEVWLVLETKSSSA